MTGLRGVYPALGVGTLCGLLGKTPQAYYKKKRNDLSQRQVRSALLSAVEYYRSKAPCMGALKLYHELSLIYGSGVVGGRDAFLRLLRSAGLMLPARKPRRTTTSCHPYISMLREHHIQVNMTEGYAPTDNAVAERMNGILKTEWIYGRSLFKDEREARVQIAGMIDFYNNERPHMSIGMKKPMDVYRGESPGKPVGKERRICHDKRTKDVSLPNRNPGE